MPVLLPGVALEVGDCRATLATLAPNSIDAVVTDPPYDLIAGKRGFMGLAWDATGVAFDPETWQAVLRVLKPGGHMLAFGGTRTSHRLVCAIEDAGFEIRDGMVHWGYSTGFPKSLNVGEGRGTALKPSHEPICLARKPLDATVVKTIAQYGTGALNIDACRISAEEGDDGTTRARRTGSSDTVGNFGFHRPDAAPHNPPGVAGRWPANSLFTCCGETPHLEGCPVGELDRQTGTSTSRSGKPRTGRSGDGWGMTATGAEYDDEGGASRFFWVAKPNRTERDFGLESWPERSGGEATHRVDGTAGLNSPRAGAGRNGGAKNDHPTVKPIQLCRYLVRLITPPGGVVLDPFCGSGTTGMAAIAEGCRFVGMDLSDQYIRMSAARIQAMIELSAAKVA